VALAALSALMFTQKSAGAAQNFEPSAQLLLPPPPPPTPASNQTVQQLEQAEREDSGRGLQFAWLTADVGFQWQSLSALHDGDLFDERVDGSALGPVFGAGAGVRLLYLALGARFRYGALSTFDAWSLGIEGSLRIPRGAWEPYLFTGLGYTRASGFEGAAEVYELGERREDLVLSGVNLQLGGGLDYFVTPVFSAGARLELSSAYWMRPQVLESGSSVYAESGSAVGFGASAFGVLGLHF
jgi:hypothetical protein